MAKAVILKAEARNYSLKAQDKPKHHCSRGNSGQKILYVAYTSSTTATFPSNMTPLSSITQPIRLVG